MMTLNERLAEILDMIGGNPVDEPELFTALDKKPLVKSEVLKLALSRGNEDIKNFGALELAAFFKKIHDKIVPTKNEKGEFKVTPKTENYRLPNFEEVEKVSSFMDRLYNMNEAARILDPSDKKGIEQNATEYVKVLSDLNDLVWEITQLNKDNLSEWEQQLVSDQVLACVTDVESTCMGKL